MKTTSSICPHCGVVVTPEEYFCPQCGKKLKDKVPSTSVLAQAGVYAVSILLPPLGLWPGVKYLRQNDEKSKRIGIAAIILTILSLAVAIYIIAGAINSFNSTLNSLTNTNLGY